MGVEIKCRQIITWHASGPVREALYPHKAITLKVKLYMTDALALSSPTCNAEAWEPPNTKESASLD
eukprot:5762747-Pyramimonas_sp.AAC.1